MAVEWNGFKNSVVMNPILTIKSSDYIDGQIMVVLKEDHYSFTPKSDIIDVLEMSTGNVKMLRYYIPKTKDVFALNDATTAIIFDNKDDAMLFKLSVDSIILDMHVIGEKRECKPINERKSIFSLSDIEKIRNKRKDAI